MMSSDFASRGDRVLSPVLGHYTRLNIVSGKGSYLYTPDGTAYLDFSAGIAVASTGHCHPKVVSAIQAQCAQLIHACAGVVYYGPNVTLAERLGEILGNNLNSVFFTQSGTEAIEACIKLAKYVTKKPGILAFEGGFHGRSLGALSLTTSKLKYRDGYAPLLDHTHFFPYPHTDTSDDLTRYFETLPDTVGAVIIEPVLGEGGYVPAPTPFLKRLRELCDARGLLLIFDEIQTGFGRTGSWFDFQNHHVVPDIIALAKGIASGMPLGACVSRPDLMAKWSTGAHGGTYGGNPVSCAAGVATIEVIAEILPAVLEKSKLAEIQLREALSDHELIRDIRVKGLMIGIELRDAALTKQIMTACLEKHVIVVSCGIHDNVIRIMPPLTISFDELTHGISCLIEVLNAHR